MTGPESTSDPFSNGHGFLPSTQAPAEVAPDALWLVFSGDKVLLGPELGLPNQRPGDSEGAVYLGQQSGRQVWGARLVGEAAQPFGLHRLRGLYGRVPDWLWLLGGYAYQIAEWDRTHRFCGNCGAHTLPDAAERVRRCPACGLSVYPRLAPAVMVLLTRRQEGRLQLLLCRSPQFPAGMYSANAGFVEPGESVEHAAHREMLEETNLDIANLRYFDSQPWPFPHSLMLAYSAEYAGGEIIPQPGEIEDARWFDEADLPALPGRASIARRLIESVVGPRAGD
ncbi:NAD(+) diphosphatase [Deinococcus rubellus]|uniref:NAD(+) diphosphatase n=1 Tax=Deinococcus rubellus TaxID=1889240 RepID=A0ABY5YMK2_9DEIO|nr:NAD(+) diphosphatase [Deinococcus rubellus]UWX65346.1 NAD(+) diphosphatase [Deinococcus rubellus]